ncbi:MAG: sarcosine oxidase subunit gamma family protein [Alphaproteobacteria bacterium]
MLNPPPRRSALAKAPARHDQIRERTDLSLWRLYGPAGGFTEDIGIELPQEPNHAIQDGDLSALWLAPGEWLLVDETAGLGARVESAGVRLSDLGHARVVFRLPASLGREVLAKGCPLDLRPAIFPPGRCAQSVLAGVAILVHHLSTGEDMEIYVARSYGRFIHDWLLDAASR